MADPLSKLFGSPARVKLLRLFLFNPTQAFTATEAALRANIPRTEAVHEFALLHAAGVIHRALRGRLVRCTLNPTFSHLQALQNLLLNTPVRVEEIYGRISRAGSIKLVVATGVFVNSAESPVDLFVVGDRMKDPVLRRSIKLMESELGKEIRYTLLSTQEFYYRMNMNDHLVRDVLDYPHRILFDRLDIGLE
ncbi:MAG TPA: hypothetical protein VG934_00070 [Candidatus Paceibacterota bacterium]|nr:hypothetical protein [Candidatus Paceibacterota bacterium]